MVIPYSKKFHFHKLLPSKSKKKVDAQKSCILWIINFSQWAHERLVVCRKYPLSAWVIRNINKSFGRWDKMSSVLSNLTKVSIFSLEISTSNEAAFHVIWQGEPLRGSIYFAHIFMGLYFAVSPSWAPNGTPHLYWKCKIAALPMFYWLGVHEVINVIKYVYCRLQLIAGYRISPNTPICHTPLSPTGVYKCANI